MDTMFIAKNQRSADYTRLDISLEGIEKMLDVMPDYAWVGHPRSAASCPLQTLAVFQGYPHCRVGSRTVNFYDDETCKHQVASVSMPPDVSVFVSLVDDYWTTLTITAADCRKLLERAKRLRPWAENLTIDKVFQPF